MYLISLYFDDNTNRILQRYINLIAEKTGNKFMTDNKVPPHMTISSIEARNVDVLIPAFEGLRGILKRGSIQFATIGQLLPYVMYAAPVLNRYLQELQETVYAAVKDIPETTVSKVYQPYSWLPHVTLGKKLDREQMKIAFDIMQQQFSTFTSTVTEIGLAKVNPHEDVVRYVLS